MLKKIPRARQNIMAAALLAGLAAAGLLVGLRVWPFGDGSLLTGDLNGLYVNYFADLRDRFWQGGFFYSFRKMAGGSTLGLFAYYMASPFNIVYLILPKAAYTEAASLCFLLRTAAAGAAFCFFIQRHLQSTRRVLAPAALCYALCAYWVVYNQNAMWMDVVILLPLVLWGLDELIARRRVLPFTLLLAAAMVVNFYIAFSVCLFCVLYFIYAYLAADVRAGGPGPKSFGLAAARFAGGGLLAAGLSAALLVPALAEVLAGGDLGTFQFTLAPNFPLHRLPERLFPGTFFWGDIQNGGMPQLYCGLFAVLLGGAFFFLRPVRLREKLAAGGVLLVLVLSMWLSGPDIVWQGLKPPTWFPHRYSFVFSLFLLVLACRALLLLRPGLKAAAGLAAGGAVFIAWAVITAEGEIISLPKIVLAAAIVLGIAGAVWLAGRQGAPAGDAPEAETKPKTRPGPLAARAGAALLCLVLVGDITANAMLSIRKFDYYSRSSYVDYTQKAEATVAALKEHDDGLYRVETTYNRTLNDPMLAGYMGISHYSSVMNDGVPLLRQQLGYVNYSVYGWGSALVADSLFGIKYLYAGGGPRTVPAHWVPLELDTPLPVYENPYAFPLAFVAPASVLMIDPAWTEDDPFLFQDTIATWMEPAAGFTLAPLAQSGKAEGNIAVTVTARHGGPLYFCLPYAGQAPAQLRANGRVVCNYFEPDTLGGVVCLGQFEAGTAVTVELDSPATEEDLAAIHISEADPAAMRGITGSVRQNAAQDLVIQDGGFISCTATVWEDLDSVLVLPFTYEENWRATVNGKPAEVQPWLGALMAVALEAGENTVELRYTHPGAGAGLAISVLALVVLIGWAMWQRWRRLQKG